ncbi:modification methylase NmeDIP [Photobacterium sp. NCIMB 13483]|uniref:DNA cytosine methyltransferase n=1 Tax=Photobacterium sp. NCIMB 13483 TaxID=2022103 RepID=UPI000D157EA2|nr:DNA cytosine methyltransferase [Photobacterium sp. NCIMB 13483]PST89013.1 modification methylase NmeDIP [Photobacterium sp. NCIMB 13483]
MSAQKQPIIFSFFSGCGFLDLGFEKSGFDVRFINEFHKPFLDAYKYSRKVMELPEPKYGHFLGSIEEFVTGDRAHELSKYVEDAKADSLVGFIGGPPCPDFSVAGKNKGSEGENGKLSRVYIDAIIKNKPDFFLFENVKGLWRTVKHRAFYDEMKARLENEGYVLTDRLTNCIEYGVPQDRDRILLFGILKNRAGDINAEQLKSKFDWEAKIKFERNIVLNKSLWPSHEAYKQNSIKEIPESLIEFKELTVECWFEKNDVYNHSNSAHHFKPKSLHRFETVLEGDDSKKSFKRLHRWRYSPTAAYGNNEVHLHPYKDRRLSAAESLAIQSLPKEFCFPQTMTLTDMFKTIGNGVPYLAAKRVAETIQNYLNSL